MFVLIRAFMYTALIVGLLVIMLPAETLAGVGITPPEGLHIPQIAGMAIGSGGALLALWCVAIFAFVGRGTPLPFDPPRRLVVQGPYRFVRNPMALGIAVLLAGAALYYQSAWVLGITVVFLLGIHLMVVGYEEPALRRLFGEEYDAYARRVRRWLPRF